MTRDTTPSRCASPRTAKHAGGFTLWPSKHTPYGVKGSTAFRGGKGDILRDFVASAKKWDIKVCYYCNPMTDVSHPPYDSPMTRL